ncbi:MAG: S8 family serine peptidase [Candidatus Nitrosocosmicus sp.]
MVDFPDEIVYPSGIKIDIDRNRWLLGLKKPYTLNQVTSTLQSPMALENPLNPDEKINHTNKRFWIYNSELFTPADMRGTLHNLFGQDFDWVAPVYSNSDISGQRGMICPLPHALILTFTTQASSDEPSISQDLYNHYSMKKSIEKSKYSGKNTYYYEIGNLNNFNAFKIKSILDSDTDVYSLIRFEHMPMIIPVSNVPNDPDYLSQWNMRRIRAGGEVTTPPDKGTTTWDLSRGSGDIVICVLDSGCDLTHPDLKFASPGVNLDTMLGNGSPVEPPGPTEIGHGTAVAGIIAATINNSLGVAGVAGDCKILPLAFVNWTEEELIRGINFASVFKAKVINMSIFFNLPDTTAVETALSEASTDSLICASTGNNNSSTINYPASSKYVMACGGTDQNDNRQSPTSSVSGGTAYTGSNFGPEMSVVAPGILIPTTDMVGTQGYNNSGDYMLDFQGTSAAVPHLSGLAGLVFSVYPAINPEEARNIIERTADKVGTLPYSIDAAHSNGTWNIEMGYGRINTLRAVLAAAAFNPDSPWYREVALEGTMVLHDYEDFGDDEEKTVSFNAGVPQIFQLGPFQTYVDIPVWIDKVGGEVRGEIRLTLDWKTDSSIDVHYNIKLYEGTSEDTTDLDGEKSGLLNVPKDSSRNLNETVLNTDEGANDFIKLEMKITNNRRI